MKKYGVMLLALLVCGAVYATQDSTLTQREVRDPRQLEAILEANATDAETRIAAVEAGTSISNLVLPGALTVTGPITNTALTASKPVFTDANKKLVSTGTLAVDQGGSGAATFTDNGVLIGNAASAFSVTAVGVDGQVLLGATGANPTWGTMGTDASISAAGAVTVSKGLAMTNGASLVNIPVAAVNGEALVKTTTFTGGGVTGTWATLTVDSLPAISGANLTGLVAANITAAGTLPQLNAAALTALSAANITAGTAVTAVDLNAGTNVAGANITGDIPLAAMTNAFSGTLYSGTYTNMSTLNTNVVVVLNGVIVSVTTTP